MLGMAYPDVQRMLCQEKAEGNVPTKVSLQISQGVFQLFGCLQGLIESYRFDPPSRWN